MVALFKKAELWGVPDNHCGGQWGRNLTDWEKDLKKKKWQKEDAGKVGSQTKVFETTDERLMECTAQSIITDWLWQIFVLMRPWTLKLVLIIIRKPSGWMWEHHCSLFPLYCLKGSAILLMLQVRKQKPSENQSRDFRGGLVVNNLPCNTGDVGSTPGWGTKIPHASEQLSPHATSTSSRTREPASELESLLLQWKPHDAKDGPMEPN